MRARGPSSWLTWVLVCLAILWCVPLLWALAGSVASDVYAGRPTPSSLTWDHWRSLGQAGLLRSLANSVLVAFISAATGTAMALTVAVHFLVRRTPRSGMVLGLFVGKLVPVAVLLIPQVWLLRSTLGPNTLLGLVLVHSLTAFLVALVLLVPGAQGLRDQYLDEMGVLGIGMAAFVRRIVFPEMRTHIALAFGVTFMTSWSEVAYANLLLTLPARRTLPVLLGQFMTAYQMLWGQMYALTVVSVAVTLAVLLVGFALVNRAMTAPKSE